MSAIKTPYLSLTCSLVAFSVRNKTLNIRHYKATRVKALLSSIALLVFGPDSLPQNPRALSAPLYPPEHLPPTVGDVVI